MIQVISDYGTAATAAFEIRSKRAPSAAKLWQNSIFSEITQFTHCETQNFYYRKVLWRL
jgi:hypothetical protein